MRYAGASGGPRGQDHPQSQDRPPQDVTATGRLTARVRRPAPRAFLLEPDQPDKPGGDRGTGAATPGLPVPVDGYLLLMHEGGAADEGAAGGVVVGVTVVVPAHNEEQYLGACLASLRLAARHVALPVEVVVVLDACSDDSAALVPADVTALTVAVGNVGAARAAGFALAQPGPGRWLATTDADCEVPLTWLADQLAAARLGADVVAGTIEVLDWSARHPSLPPAFSALYTPGAGHRHIHGANLGLSAVTYQLMGGFRPLRVHEDVDLVDRCLSAGASICWSAAAPVITSARVSTRTPHGFSSHLSALELSLTEGDVA